NGWSGICFESRVVEGGRLFRQERGSKAPIAPVVSWDRRTILSSVAAVTGVGMEAKGRWVDSRSCYRCHFICSECHAHQLVAVIGGVLSSVHAVLGIASRQHSCLCEPFPEIGNRRHLEALRQLHTRA